MLMAARCTPNQRGFTLLEVLVTIVIVSIGLLGLLGLQTVSLVNTQVSAARSQASVAADSMADRIRANPKGATDGDYTNVAHPAASNPPDPQCNSGSTCSTDEMAAFDAWDWDRSLATHTNHKGEQVSGLLPNGAGYIDCVEHETPGGNTSNCLSYRITVAWHERGTGQTRAPCDHKNLTDPCFSTLVRP